MSVFGQTWSSHPSWREILCGLLCSYTNQNPWVFRQRVIATTTDNSEYLELMIYAILLDVYDTNSRSNTLDTRNHSVVYPPVAQ